MNDEEPPAWESYEEVARFLLQKWGAELGLGLDRVEGKQRLVGESGTSPAIDAKGVKVDDGAIVVVECRRYTTSKLKQSAVASLAYSIRDLGASGGIIVTPIGVQRGGQIIAEKEGIEIVHLDADSDATSYIMKFLGNVIVGVRAARLTAIMHAPEVRITPSEVDE
jgi:hypothetical protein